MIWQDFVIGLMGIVFIYSLLPQIFKIFKGEGDISLQTSGLTGTGMIVLSYTQLTLTLIFSAVISAITAILWLTIFFQTIILKYINPKHFQT